MRRLIELAEPFAAGLTPTEFLLQSRLVFIVVFHGLAAFLDAEPEPGPAEVEQCRELLVRNVAAMLASARPATQA